MSYLFYNLKYNVDISKWNVSKVKNMEWIFADSEFDKDISNWKIYSLRSKSRLFDNSSKKLIIPYWHKDYKEDLEERKKQIDTYHLNQKIEDNLIIKNNKKNKI